MSVIELRKLTLDQLVAERETKITETRESRKSHAAGELTNPRVLRNQRREIATINTLIAEKQRDATSVDEPKRRETKSKEKDNA